jgi:hypothetical protein
MIEGINNAKLTPLVHRYDPASGQGELTERYLRDRAAMLAWMNKINTEDTPALGGGTGIEVYSVPHPGTPYRFKDEASQTQINLGGGVDPLTQVSSFSDGHQSAWRQAA